ncbi:MAG: DMT family transporter [Desulfotalea sp.]
MTVQSKYIPVIALITAMIIWSSSFIGLKIAFRAYDPMMVIFGRLVIASCIFLCFYKFVFKNFKYQKGDYKPILLMSIFEPCLYFIFEGIALSNTSASQAGIITATSPIFVLIAATIFLNEKYNLKVWFGSFVALAGVCWITLASTPDTHAPNPILGNFFEALAMICATGYTIALKNLCRRYSPLFLTASQAIIGTLFYLPIIFMPIVDKPIDFPFTPSLAVIYLGSAVTIGAYGLYNYSLKLVPAAQAASYINLIPLFSVAMAWLILGEKLNTSQLLAAITIIFSVWFTQKSMRKSL